MKLLLLSFGMMGLAASGFGQQNAPRGFDAWDTDKDGKLTRMELPAPLRGNFEKVDRDGDGFISREEDASFRRGGDRPAAPQQGGMFKGIRSIADLDYAGTGEERHRLDLFVPESRGDETLPLLVWIHGGGWKAGSKAFPKNILPYVAEGRFVGASINYRLSSDAIWPAQIHDCKAAIRWLKANADEYGIDPGRIAVWGSSAGGHLVAMLGVSQGVDGLEGEIGSHLEESSAVNCVVNWFGPANLATMNDHPSTINHNAPDSPEGLLLGGAIPRNEEAARSASPVTHVSGDDAPMLLVHGTEDQLVPYAQSVELKAALEEAGVPAILITVQGGGHGGGFGREVAARVDRFLAQRLEGAEGSMEDETVAAE